MTQPQDPRKQPLQDDEIALARVLRALPAGEPPSRLDAAILAAATDAVAASSGERPRAGSPKRILPWLPTWAIGTAAAAVLAVGIGVQLRPPLAPTVAPQAEQAPAHRPLPESRPRMDIELPEPQLAPPPPPPAPPPAQPAQMRTERQAPLPPPPPPPPAPESPPPSAPAPAAAMADAFPAAPVVAEEAAAADGEALDSITVTGTRVSAPPEAGDQARRRHQSAYAARAAERAQAEREALARQEAEAGASAQREAAAKAAAAGSAPVAASPPPVAAAPPAPAGNNALPPLADDANLAIDAWFDRIRDRRDAGDLAGARESLARLRAAHPDATLPDDLADLR